MIGRCQLGSQSGKRFVWWAKNGVDKAHLHSLWWLLSCGDLCTEFLTNFKRWIKLLFNCDHIENLNKWNRFVIFTSLENRQEKHDCGYIFILEFLTEIFIKSENTWWFDSLHWQLTINGKLQYFKIHRYFGHDIIW